MTEGGTFPEKPYIIIVESNPDEMYRLSQALRSRDMRVQGVSDEKDLTRLISRELPDLIVLDVQLATDDGHEILRHIRVDESIKRVKVVAVTASDEEMKLWAEGADAIVKKPVSQEAFIVAIDRLLRNG